MAMAKIKKGDTVVVLAGKDKGKTGEVTSVMPKESKVVVSGVNTRIRHVKPTQADPQGGKKPFEAPLHVSNVALTGKDGKATRVRFETDKDGNKFRVAVKSGEKIDG